MVNGTRKLSVEHYAAFVFAALERPSEIRETLHRPSTTDPGNYLVEFSESHELPLDDQGFPGVVVCPKWIKYAVGKDDTGGGILHIEIVDPNKTYIPEGRRWLTKGYSGKNESLEAPRSPESIRVAALDVLNKL